MSGLYRGPNSSAVADALNIDGDKGDLTVSNSGVIWTIDNGVVTTAKLGGDITTAGKALLDDADATAQRATLGLGNASTATIGTEVLAYDANLQNFVNTFTLPTVDSTSGYVLSTNGSGVLQLVAPGVDINDGAVTTAKLANDAVTYAKIQNVSEDKLLGRTTGSGDVEEISCTSAGRALLDDADNTAQRTTLGLGTLATLNSVANANITANTIGLDKLARVGTSGQVLTSAGVGADPAYQTLSFVPQTSVTGSADIPHGTTAQRDGSPLIGFFRFNTTTAQFEGYNGTAWGSVGGGATGAGGDQVFVENSQVVTTSYTITAGKSASCTGPLTINNGITVTIPNGSRLVIL